MAQAFIQPVGNNVRDYKRYVAKSMCLVDIRQKVPWPSPSS